MMMNHTSKSPFRVQPGTIVSGKWHGNQYTIIKELGYGANGVVYLANHRNTQVALKMSENGMSITSEVNVLKSFAKVQGSTLGPSLLDVDDWQSKQGVISFYVMEYIKGPDLLTFLQQKGSAWMPVLLLQLLNDLTRLHENDWVFGDLKPENLIVMGPPPRIRCIDVGGTTIRGRAIKEFTEFYDRGYWGLGSRKADAPYDLFAAAMIMVNAAYPKRFPKAAGGIAQLREAIRQKPMLLRYERVLLNALQGRYFTAKDMREDLIELLNKSSVTPPSKPAASATQHRPSKTVKPDTPLTRQRYHKKKKKSGWVEFFVLAFIAAFIYGGYIFLKLL